MKTINKKKNRMDKEIIKWNKQDYMADFDK